MKSLLQCMVLILAAWLTVASEAAGLAPVKATPPNFVVLILDDWGWDASGAYGNPNIHTPHIDQLARQGAVFHNMYLAASTCTSSRTSILSGLYPFRAGAPRLGTAAPSSTRLVSSYLQEAGYFTASIGKWHLGGELSNQFNLVKEEQPQLGDKAGGEEDWVDVIQHRLPANKPFFLWLAAKDPHRPWFNEPHWNLHQPGSLPIPPYIEINSTHSPAFIRSELAQYYNEIYRADYYIGQVIEALQHQHRLDNTIVILMSDNGPPFWRAKKFLTTPGVKTPFIVYWPSRIPTHVDKQQLLSAVDIAPTLLELAGVNQPTAFEGKSFAAILRGDEDREINEYVYGERGDMLLASSNGRSIRSKQFVYIVDDYKQYAHCDHPSQFDTSNWEQLYDNTRDPANLHNLVHDSTWLKSVWHRLAGQEDYRPVLQNFRQLMLARRTARQDLPEPIIDGNCPTLWWKDDASDKKETKATKD